jgi:3-hydroxyisobutyrate dehydrogenase-like beta-hydroxyacid dehydrogenase
VALPLTAVVDQLFGSMRWTGRGGLDHSGVIEVLEVLSGGDHDE